MATKTYNSSLLSSSDLYKVRLAIGDAPETINDAILDDDEINFAVSSSTGLRAAAIAACDMAMSRLNRIAISHSKGRISEQAAQMMDHFAATRARLVQGSGDLFNGKTFISGTDMMHVGGVYESDIEALDDDTSLRQPAFKREDHEHPGTPSSADRDEDETWG